MERVKKLANMAIGLALFVVLLGAWTRLNDAGLGCPDWPGCYGELVLPLENERLRQIQQLYPENPLDASKGWLEMVHRYAAGSLGVLIAALALIAWRRRHLSGYPAGLSLTLLGLVVLQALFGMWTVTLKLLPQVVTLHLLGGFLTLTLLVRLRQRLGEPRAIRSRLGRRHWIFAGLLLLYLQVALGGWTSANYAGWACSHWWQCGKDQIIALDYRQGFSLPSVGEHSHEGGLLPVEARAAIQMVHRVAAALITLYLLLLCWMTCRQRATRGPAAAVATGLLLQLMLGIANVVTGLPPGLAIAHHAGAVMLLLSLLWLYQRSGQSSEGERRYASES